MEMCIPKSQDIFRNKGWARLSFPSPRLIIWLHYDHNLSAKAHPILSNNNSNKHSHLLSTYSVPGLPVPVLSALEEAGATIIPISQMGN